MQDSNVQAKTKGQTQTKVNAQVQSDISTGAMVVATSIPAVIGLWAVACFVGGMVASGGPISMAQSFFTAVTGV